MKQFLKVIPILLIGFNSYAQNKPTTTRCKDKTIERVRKHCVCNDIETYVKENYNILSVSSYAQSGLNRIYVRFNIINEGKISNIQVKGSSPELEKEAFRTLQSFPDIIPATSVSEINIDPQDFYNILIQFEIKNTITNL
ncbi:hypothetical protein D1818_16765 [Aquimarina sp. BL5]|uniref:hypothetical protein n=1 Tax=Aquimarina sp. BL5 TaxID=1714860 RepID=UPI000E4C2F27|nr:hypothetical protein [Aquimarina sp. BL5]AXT52410.1 hypothetical protein D1818_16765 [Aquimarina sp. BL5]RKM87630.1 hypothetical protein D7036_25070 [Aquimarina sp. BL5]